MKFEQPADGFLKFSMFKTKNSWQFRVRGADIPNFTKEQPAPWVTYLTFSQADSVLENFSQSRSFF
jgi:hypothetical protein